MIQQLPKAFFSFTSPNVHLFRHQITNFTFLDLKSSSEELIFDLLTDGDDSDSDEGDGDDDCDGDDDGDADDDDW